MSQEQKNLTEAYDDCMRRISQLRRILADKEEQLLALHHKKMDMYTECSVFRNAMHQEELRASKYLAAINNPEEADGAKPEIVEKGK